LSFAPPYSNDKGTFAISGNNLILNPAGPGVSAYSDDVGRAFRLKSATHSD
jgi:hypothetical protein